MTAVGSGRPVYEEVLERGLGRTLGRPVSIATVSSRPVEAYSCHPISILAVTLSSGEEISVVFKRLEPAPDRDVGRELLLYRRVLAGGRFGAPLLYASFSDERRRRYWLFLENVGGWRLDWCEADRWPHAFRWLASLHAAYEGDAVALRALDFLPEHGPAFYRRLARGAQRSVQRHGEPAAAVKLKRVLAGLDDAIAHLASEPRTLVHGDLSCKNLLVHNQAIRPIDWEWAALGPAAWDVDKLLAGWGPEKPRLLGCYLDERERLGAPVDGEAFERSLAHCRILRGLWCLRWWTQSCRDPVFVGGLIREMDILRDRLAAGAVRG